MLGFGKKKRVNPFIKRFERNLKKRGLFLVDAHMNKSSVFIPKSEEFINYVKRSGVRTVFRDDNKPYYKEFIMYFYPANGVIVYFRIKKKVTRK